MSEIHMYINNIKSENNIFLSDFIMRVPLSMA